MILTLVAIVLVSLTVRATATASEFVVRDGVTLQLDGQPFHFTGLNIYNAYDIDLDSALTRAGAGQEVFRAWFFQSEATVNGRRDWTALDRVLRIARAHNVRVIPVLGDQWGASTDGPEKFLPWWPSPYGGDGYRAARWNATDLTPYRQWVADVVTRYRDDPTVAFWQLINEGEARNANGSFDETVAAHAIRAFADDVGGLAKQIDPNHLVSLGTIAGEAGSQGADYAFVNQAPSVDIADYHDYGFPYSPLGNADPKNGLGVSIARIHGIGKAIMAGEIGIHWSKLDRPSLSRRSDLFDQKLSAESDSGIVGSLLWCWSDPASRTWDYEIGPSDPSLALLAKY